MAPQLFYLFAVIFLIHEFFVLSMEKDLFIELEIIRKKSKKEKLKFSEYSDEMKTYLIINIAYILYTFSGLLTSQYPLFLLIILISVIPKRLLILKYIDSFLSIAILMFIVLNNFHFHIDIETLILSQFK